MEFPWLESSVPAALTRTFSRKSRSAWAREVRDRAGTLMRLGYSREVAEARCARRLSWELGLDGTSKTAGEVASIVASVYARA